MKEKVKIFDVAIDNISFEDARGFAEDVLLEDKNVKIFTPNSEILLKARKDKEFKDILNRADLLVPDSAGLLFFSELEERVAGVDLMLNTCALAEKHNRSVFLFGGRGVAEKTKKNLEKSFPQIRVVGFSEDESSCYNAIERTKPDIVFVALGAPKQEFWISENMGRFPSVNIFMGVGGAFDMISGKIKRAPLFMQKMYLEWLWRLAKEPERIGRIFNAVVVFPLCVFKEKLNKIFN